MPKILLKPPGRSDVSPLAISERLRSQLVYFSSPLPPTATEGECYFAPEEVDRWVDEGVFYLVSPLDTANMTEVELSEEQETFLQWLQRHKIDRVVVLE